MFLALAALALVAAVVAVACGGGDSGDRPSSRKIPTATAYAILPEPTILSGGVPVTGRGGGDTYVVKAGDTLASIAAELGVPIEELIRLNNLEDPSRLEVDQVLRIPPRGGATPGPGTSGTPRATSGAPSGAEEYEVQSGDNASDIAARFGVTIEELAEANDMTVDELRTLYVGQVLKIPQFPGRTPEPTSIPEPEPAVTEEPVEEPTEPPPEEAPPEETPIPEEIAPTPFEDIGGGVETATPEGGV